MTARKKKPATPELTAASFNRMARRLEKLEREVATLRAEKKAAEPKPPKAPRVTKARILEQLQQERETRALVQDGMIATNVLADFTRLLGDCVKHGVATPRPGMDGAYEEARATTATAILLDLSTRQCQEWIKYRPTLDVPKMQIEPADARRWHVARMRHEFTEGLHSISERVSTDRTTEIFDNERPSTRFDRVNAAPKAVDDGIELARQVISNVLDALEQDVPNISQPDGFKSSQEGVFLVQQSMAQSVLKHRPPLNLDVRTHEELLAECYIDVSLKAMEDAFNLMGYGRTRAGWDGMPSACRVAGAVLTQMNIAQRADPDNYGMDTVLEEGPKNGMPAQNAVAVQVREMTRVLDVVIDSLYNGELQEKVQQTYLARVEDVLPGQEPRVLTDDFLSNGWKPAHDMIKKTNDALYRIMQKQDGYIKLPTCGRASVASAASTLQ